MQAKNEPLVNNVNGGLIDLRNSLSNDVDEKILNFNK